MQNLEVQLEDMAWKAVNADTNNLNGSLSVKQLKELIELFIKIESARSANGKNLKIIAENALSILEDHLS